jgi:hypothetical protein
MLNAPCYKSCPLFAFEIVEKSNIFGGRKHVRGTPYHIDIATEEAEEPISSRFSLQGNSSGLSLI